MAARCQVAGRVPGVANAVSHSHRRTRRRRSPNIEVKTYSVVARLRRENRRI